MDNQFFKNEESFNILEYVKENFYGLILLLSIFFIIYFVDYITRLNNIIYSTPSIIQGLTFVNASPQKISKRKFKKR